jgi:hypothetical protein
MGHGFIIVRWHFKFYAVQRLAGWPSFEVSSGRHKFSSPRVDRDTWRVVITLSCSGAGTNSVNGKEEKDKHEQTSMMGYLRYLHNICRLTWVKQIRDVSLRDAKSTTSPCGLLKWHKRLAFRKFTWKPNMAVLIDMYIYIICIYIYRYMYSHRYTYI